MKNKKEHVSTCLGFSICAAGFAMQKPRLFPLVKYRQHLDVLLHAQSLQRHQPPSSLT